MSGVHFEMRLFPVDAQPLADIVGNTCNRHTLTRTNPIEGPVVINNKNDNGESSGDFTAM